MLLRIGAAADDLPATVVDVWPENEATLAVFAAMQTQWALASMGGVVGLRYEALPAVLDLLKIKKSARRDVFAGLRVMESEAMQVLNDGG